MYILVHSYILQAVHYTDILYVVLDCLTIPLKVPLHQEYFEKYLDRTTR